VIDAIRQGLKMALDLVMPPLCLSCSAIVADTGTLCPQCWRDITFLEPPLCAACGLPFELECGPEALCGACAARLPPFRRARSVFRYDDASKKLILRFKYADRLEGAPAFARWMARAAADLAADADMVVPVPLHRWRLLARRYNQAAVLAQALARVIGRPAEPDVLIRRRATRAMVRMNRGQRAKNVKGAFEIHPRRRDRIQGKTILLVDDILTTGSTVGACAKVLLAAGAAAVDVVTLGRVIR
jgi:ComF family protein